MNEEDFDYYISILDKTHDLRDRLYWHGYLEGRFGEGGYPRSPGEDGYEERQMGLADGRGDKDGNTNN